MCFGTLRNMICESSTFWKTDVAALRPRQGRLRSWENRFSLYNVFWHISAAQLQFCFGFWHAAEYDLREFHLLENRCIPHCARSSTFRNGVRETSIPFRISQHAFSQTIAICKIRLTRAPKTLRQAHISQNAFRKVLLSAALGEPGTQNHTTVVRFRMWFARVATLCEPWVANSKTDLWAHL